MKNKIRRFYFVLPLCIVLTSIPDNLFSQSWKNLKEKELEYINSENYKQALEIGQLELKSCEKRFGSSNKKYGESLHTLSGINSNLGNYKEALHLCIEAQKIKKYSEGNIFLVNDLGTLYQINGQAEKAIEYFMKLQEMVKIEFGTDHPNYGVCLNNLAGCYDDIGNYEKALQLYLESKDISEKTQGKDDPEYALRLNNVASSYEYLGRYEDALPLYLESISVVEKTHGKNSVKYGLGINNLAGLYRKMCRYDDALRLYKEAITIAEQNTGVNSNYYITYISNLAHVYGLLKQYDLEIMLEIEACEKTEKLFGKTHPDYIRRLNNLATAYSLMNKFELALKLMMDSVNEYEKAGMTENPDYAAALSNLAYLYFENSQFEDAIICNNKALKIKEVSLGREHSSYRNTLTNLANCYRLYGKNQEAFPLYIEARKSLYNQMSKIFTILNEQQQESFYSKEVDLYLAMYKSFYTGYFNENKSISGYYYDDELVQKGLLLQSSLSVQQSINASNDSILIESNNYLRSLKRSYVSLSNKPVKERAESIDSLKEVISILENEITTKASKLDGFKGFFNPELSWKDIQKKLKSNEAAIEFSSFKYTELKYNGKILYYALIIRPDYEYPKLIFLFEEKSIQSIIEKSGRVKNQKYVTSLYNNEIPESTQETENEYENLYSLIWKPLDSCLSGINTIYYAPSGMLNSISFAAIKNGKGQLLCDMYKLITLTSTRNLLNNHEINNSKPKSIVLYGGVEYDADSSIINTVNLNKKEIFYSNRSIPNGAQNIFWNYLPGTLTEVNKIEKIFISEKVKVKKYSDYFATEESFKALNGKNSPEVIHLATHGYYLPRKKTDTIKNESGENPMTRSGLLLAGANYTWNNEQFPTILEDGILSASEISNIWLGGTKLAVLSACETGLGDIKGSEGVFGLQRAFKLAGVDYILMSLWQVPDAETAEFMEVFYTKWINGESIRDAFNKTQVFMKSKYDPYFWAAFVLTE